MWWRRGGHHNALRFARCIEIFITIEYEEIEVFEAAVFHGFSLRNKHVCEGWYHRGTEFFGAFDQHRRRGVQDDGRPGDIGLTRRLDPDDRVRELGDASVPFLFDTHAMIYSENAPALEAALHTEFAGQRINLQNMRKEFFRVGIDAVEEAVMRLAPEAAFFKDREAQEWHETMARRNASLAALQMLAENEALPAEI